LKESGFTRGSIDSTLFIKWKGNDYLLVQVYVDDIIFASSDRKMCKEFEQNMKAKFEMSAMGELTFFLGLQVDQLKDGFFIHQSKYVKDLLTRFNMTDCKEAVTPIATNHGLCNDKPNDPHVDATKYRAIIGSLMYLTASRPDIVFAVSKCARYQANPKESHMKAAKRILRYVKTKPRLGLWYPMYGSFDFVAYTDSDFGGDDSDRKSTSGGCQFLGGRIVSWQCKKQTSVAQSSCEAEYIAAGYCCSQVLWIQQQLRDYGMNISNTPICIDNKSAIDITKNPKNFKVTKHIDIKYHFIRDCFEKKFIHLEKVITNDNLADLYTKAFDGPRLEKLYTLNGMKNAE
jgi:hypothetical protein